MIRDFAAAGSAFGPTRDSFSGECAGRDGWLGGGSRRGWMIGFSKANYAARILEEHFRVAALEGFGLVGHAQATAAAGALVHYLRETSAIGARSPEDSAVIPSLRPAGAGLEHLDRIAYYEQQDAMILDAVTVRNLELVEPSTGDDASATLLRAIDDTATGMGARLLRGWILRPEIVLGEIEARLDAVAELKAQTVAREEIRNRTLEGILDLERLTSRVTLGVATPRDLLALRGSLERIPALRQLLAGAMLSALSDPSASGVTARGQLAAFVFARRAR